MTARLAVLLVPALLAGCASVPQPRPVRPGERLTVEDLAIEVPDEPGWVAFHQASRTEHVLVLGRDRQGEAPGRLVTVRMVEGGDPAWGRGRLVEHLRANAGTLVAGYAPVPAAAGEDPVRPVARLGPDAARLSLRPSPAAPAASEGPARLEHLWAIPPEGPDRRYLVQVEAADAEEDAGRLLERVEWRDRAAPRSQPDATTSVALQLSPGAAIGTLHGRRVAGADVGVGGLVQHEPAQGWGWLGGFDLRLRAIGGGEEIGLVTTAGLLAGVIHGRWRLYGGLEVGATKVDELRTRRRLLLGFVVGPRVGASVDLLRIRNADLGRGADVFLAVDAIAATPDLALATATLGVRFIEPR